MRVRVSVCRLSRLSGVWSAVTFSNESQKEPLRRQVTGYKLEKFSRAPRAKQRDTPCYHGRNTGGTRLKRYPGNTISAGTLLVIGAQVFIVLLLDCPERRYI